MDISTVMFTGTLGGIPLYISLLSTLSFRNQKHQIILLRMKLFREFAILKRNYRRVRSQYLS